MVASKVNPHTSDADSLEDPMPRGQSLTNMSVDALLKMRDDISAALASKADVLRKQLVDLGESVANAGRSVIGKKRGTLAGTKVAPKYRGPKGELWAGRGAEPVWMRDAIKGGKKREDFLIDKSSMPPRKATGKKSRPAKRRPAKKKKAA